MELPPNVDLVKLQKYIDDEREKKAEAEKAVRRALMDSKLEEIEAMRAAASKADAERDRAADPAFRAAELIQRIAGDEWPALIALLKASSMARVAAAMTRLDGQREAAIRHAGVTTAGPAREDARQAVVAERKTAIERQLAAAGILADVTSEEAA